METKEILNDKIFHHYCKIDNPLTPFATKLTGITQEMCNNGLPFKEVVSLFTKWLKDNGFNNQNSVIVTCGNWDFKTAFVKQCEYSNINVPGYCKNWYNVKDVFKRTYNIYSGSMMSMLKYLKIRLDGKHHSGIDDAKNIAKICIQLLKDKADFYY